MVWTTELKYFNSTMVRLKAKLIKHNAEGYIFQFHYGTIKSRLARDVEFTFRDFNSTMVRLKEFCVSIEPRPPTNFNSTMVRLKERCVACFKVRGFYFNSTMVRLKAPKNRVHRRFFVKFQFHYGTIKSQMCILSPCYLNQFQFHYGTIKS